MDSFEEFMQKAMEQLKETKNNTQDTIMLRGIGYALLALATSVKEKGENS